MKVEECKLCSVNGWGGGGQGPATTDFSISSLMRPTHQHVDQRQDALLMSAYLFKLGDYPFYTLHDHYANVGVAGASGGEYRVHTALHFAPRLTPN